MFIKYPITLLLFVTLCLANQDVPLQSKPYGFSVGDPYGTMQIQFFLDFQCPDSKDSYNTWVNVRKALSLQQNKIKLTYQFSPLPYHFYASVIHQAFFYVLKNAGSSAAQNFISYVFSKQDDLTEQAYINKTMNEFISQFTQKIASATGVDANSLAKDLVFGSDSFKTLREHWRYTTIIHGVAGTPIFYLNGVRIDGAEDFSYLDWIDFIKKYKPVNNHITADQ